MQVDTGTNRENRGVREYVNKVNIYNEFILWSAMPDPERIKLGIENKTQFAEYYKIGKNTPSIWQQRPDFKPRVDKILVMWALDRKPNVIRAIYNAAVKGNPFSQALWLGYFEKYNVKENGGEAKGEKVELTVDDIRFGIEQLPEQMKQKHYDNLREILDDIVAHAQARDVEADVQDSDWSDRPETEISTEADYTTQDVPSKRADEVPVRDTKCIRANLVWTPFARDNKSPSRRWKE